MKLIIRPLSANFLTACALAKPSELDLFNAQGCLLVEKGKRVTQDILKRVQR